MSIHSFIHSTNVYSASGSGPSRARGSTSTLVGPEWKHHELRTLMILFIAPFLEPETVPGHHRCSANVCWPHKALTMKPQGFKL